MRKRTTATLIACMAISLSGWPSLTGQETAPAAETTRPTAAQVTAEAVLVDIVVRDKKGRPVTDLKREEIEIFEDGVKQEVQSFGFVQQALAFEEEAKAGAKATGTPEGGLHPISSLDHINLVTFVFDGLSLEARSLALQASEECQRRAAPEITFQEGKDAAGKTTYRMRFGVLSLIKDSTGRVVEKLSQDYPVREIPADQIEAMRRGTLVFVRQVSLSPGRHTVETAVREEETQKAGARKTVLVVPEAQPGVRISSLAAIRRVDRVTPEDVTNDNPLAFPDGKVVPTVGGDPIPAGRKEPLGLYLIVYPDPADPGPPKLFFELAQNGVPIGRSELQLSKPDQRGRIQHIATLPVETLKAGDYEVRAIATQGAHSVQEQMLIRIQ